MGIAHSGLWLVAGAALSWVVNVVRIVLIAWAAAVWGRDPVMQLLRPELGLILPHDKLRSAPAVRFHMVQAERGRSAVSNSATIDSDTITRSAAAPLTMRSR